MTRLAFVNGSVFAAVSGVFLHLHRVYRCLASSVGMFPVWYSG